MTIWTLQIRNVSILFTALALLSTSSLAKALKQEPPAGSLRPGESVLVDDATCPQGQIKQITSGDSVKGINRTSRCIASNGSVHDDPGLGLSALQSGLEIIRSTHDFTTVWFRLERPKEAPLELAVGAAPDEKSIGIGSLSKSITAIGIALLIQEGKLRLEDTLGDLVADYFTERKIPLSHSLRAVTVSGSWRTGQALQPRGQVTARLVYQTKTGVRILSSTIVPQ
jgi:CubicO group peptidase (beta-lactamase class C family)